MRHKSKMAIIGLALCLVVVSTAFVYAWFRQITSQHSVHIKSYGFRMYEDPECTIEKTSFDWGDVDVQISYYSEAYLKNLDTSRNMSATWWLSELTITGLTGYTVQGMNTCIEVLKDGEIVLYLTILQYKTVETNWRSLNHTASDTLEFLPDEVIRVQFYICSGNTIPSDSDVSFTIEMLGNCEV